MKLLKIQLVVLVGITFLLAVACGGSGTSTPSPESVELAPIRDNTLYESDTGSLSNGAGTNFFVGKNNSGVLRRGVIMFDVAGNIPPGVEITGASLTLNMSRTAAAQQTIELQKLLVDWGEGASNTSGTGGGGATSSTGDATWVHSFFPDTNWATPGGDFLNTTSADISVDDTGKYTWGSTDQMTADVQDWLDAPSNNYGWILVGNETEVQTTKRFDSRENETEANRPVLTVTFVE